MRKWSRALVVSFLAILSSVALGVVSAFMASLALGATALIVPGTGTPNANIVDLYREHATDRFIAPFVTDPMTMQPVCTSTNGCKLEGVDYPASFWPLGFIGNWCPGYQCDKWDESVGLGVEHLDTALHDALDTTTGEVILFGYSQGGAVVSNELGNIGDLTPEELSRLRVVMIGNAYNPDGGIFTRLGFLGHVPLIDVTFGQATPVDTGIPMTAIGFQYDPVMYAPLYWGNPFSMLNALAAFQTVHGYYLTPNENGPNDPIAYGYSQAELAEQLDRNLHPENFREDSHGNVYVMIPAKSLPIVDLVTSVVPAALQPVVKPVADLVSPILKVFIDLGYDWSGDPGVERWLSPLPFNPIQNWPAVGVKLIAATIQGIQAFIGDLGGLTTMIAPTTQVPVTNTPVSTLAAARTAVAEDTSDTSAAEPSTRKLSLVKDDDTTVQQTAAETDTASASTDQTPVTEPEETTKPEAPADEKKADETKADETKADDTKADDTKADDTKADDTEAADDTTMDKADEKKADEKKADEKKADEKKADEKKTHAKSDNEKNSDTDKKDADSAKAAA
jgi:PE-PPE domain